MLILHEHSGPRSASDYVCSPGPGSRLLFILETMKRTIKRWVTGAWVFAAECFHDVAVRFDRLEQWSSAISGFHDSDLIGWIPQVFMFTVCMVCACACVCCSVCELFVLICLPHSKSIKLQMMLWFENMDDCVFMGPATMLKGLGLRCLTWEHGWLCTWDKPQC